MLFLCIYSYRTKIKIGLPTCFFSLLLFIRRGLALEDTVTLIRAHYLLKGCLERASSSEVMPGLLAAVSFSFHASPLFVPSTPSCFLTRSLPPSPSSERVETKDRPKHYEWGENEGNASDDGSSKPVTSGADGGVFLGILFLIVPEDEVALVQRARLLRYERWRHGDDGHHILRRGLRL